VCETRSQARRRDSRICATGDHQVQLWWEMLEQIHQLIVDLAGINQVIVVEDEHDLVWKSAEVVEQQATDGFNRRLRCGKDGQRRRPDAWRRLRSAAMTYVQNEVA
jgi:hypothetical protein